MIGNLDAIGKLAIHGHHPDRDEKPGKLSPA